MFTLRLRVPVVVVFSAASLLGLVSCTTHKESPPQIPANIQAIFNKPAYQGAVWGLRAIDLDSGRTLIDVQPDYHFLIGSVRKVFSVGELLNQIGPDYHYDTPVYRKGSIDGSGVLKGDLILVASGDLTMGGRRNSDGSIAVSNWDHNEADALGNAVLTAPDPLAGYKEIARQIAGSGIKEVKGEVVIDDRLFQPFDFREQFDVRPVFVNDDAVDVSINPTGKGKPASMTHRPESAALAVKNNLMMGGSEMNVAMNPELPSCIGQPGCAGTVAGNLPMEFVPPFTGKYPLVRTFRIVQPSNYARTVLIEALKAAGVKVDAPIVEANPTRLLPAKNSYSASDQVAKLTGMTYINDARLILKISYNIGADTSLVLYGLTQNVDNMKDALVAEKKNLSANYGIADTAYSFVDGSGGGNDVGVARRTTSAINPIPMLNAKPNNSKSNTGIKSHVFTLCVIYAPCSRDQMG